MWLSSASRQGRAVSYSRGRWFEAWSQTITNGPAPSDFPCEQDCGRSSAMTPEPPPAAAPTNGCSVTKWLAPTIPVIFDPQRNDCQRGAYRRGEAEAGGDRRACGGARPRRHARSHQFRESAPRRRSSPTTPSSALRRWPASPARPGSALLHPPLRRPDRLLVLRGLPAAADGRGRSAAPLAAREGRCGQRGAEQSAIPARAFRRRCRGRHVAWRPLPRLPPASSRPSPNPRRPAPPLHLLGGRFTDPLRPL